ncbi:neurogenic locus notch -like protein [Brachionus plicatilis]|uniref:Neurogenic locus notch-like protein n=1 Tax=Brachionus plicatilis TaxID=10195 RepID=A0A3M7Q2W1_BRAPC|nr:neurogenic locus notch -like protein [Brachionus plicatilis]
MNKIFKKNFKSLKIFFNEWVYLKNGTQLNAEMERGPKINNVHVVSNNVQNQITKQKIDFYERLCSNELTRKILQHSSKHKLDKDILEEVAIIIEEYSEYHLVSSQVSTSDKIKTIKYVIDVDFKADKESNNNSKSIRQLLQSRKTNLKEDLYSLKFKVFSHGLVYLFKALGLYPWASMSGFTLATCDLRHGSTFLLIQEALFRMIKIFFIFFLIKLFSNGCIKCQIFVSGGDDKLIRIFQNDSIVSIYDAQEDIICLDARVSKHIVVAGRSDKNVLVWNFKNNSTISVNEIASVYSILIINDTHFVAGYDGKIIFWSIDLQTKIHFQNQSFSKIRDLKRLKIDKILIASSNRIVFAYSLSENRILDSLTVSNNSTDELRSIDLLNKTFIVKFCKLYTGVNAVRILDEKTVLLGGWKLKYWDIDLNIIKGIDDAWIRSIELLNEEVFIAGDGNGNIEFWNSKNMSFIKRIFLGNNEDINALVNLNISLIDFEFTNGQNFRMISTEDDTMLLSSQSETKNSSTSSESMAMVTKKLNWETIIQSSVSSLYDLNITSSNRLDQTTSSFYSVIGTKPTIDMANFSQETQFTFESLDIGLIMDLSQLNLDMNDCLSNCSGNGKCKVSNSLKFECECFKNYVGTKCHINTLACNSNPCRNNATCIDNINNRTYTCKCMSNDNRSSLFYGLNCEKKIDVCQNETCSGNGVCYDGGFEPKCKCFSKYSGDKCQIESQEMKTIKAIIALRGID